MGFPHKLEEGRFNRLPGRACFRLKEKGGGGCGEPPGQPLLLCDPQPGGPSGPHGKWLWAAGSPVAWLRPVGGLRPHPTVPVTPRTATRADSLAMLGCMPPGAPEATAGGLGGVGGSARADERPAPAPASGRRAGGGGTQAQEVCASAGLILITSNLWLKITQSQPEEDYSPKSPYQEARAEGGPLPGQG